MKWIDLADDERALFEERRKTDPTCEEPTAKVNWRSEDFRWRVCVDDIGKPESERFWNVWDMRGVEEPWGPKPKGFATSKPLLLRSGVADFRKALIWAELAAMSDKVRLALHAAGLVKHMIEQAQSILEHERRH